MKSYKMTGNFLTIVQNYGGPAVLLIAACALLLSGLPMRHQGVMRWFPILWSLGAVWQFVSTLRIPREIALDDAGNIIFRGVIGQRVIRVDELRRIKPAALQRGWFVVRHQRGSIMIHGQFEGFHELIGELERRNHHLLIQGC